MDRRLILDRPDKVSAFRRIVGTQERKLTLPRSIPTAVEAPSQLPKSVISHTAESLAQSSTSRDNMGEVKKTEEKRSKSPEQAAPSTEMWRPW